MSNSAYRNDSLYALGLPTQLVRLLDKKGIRQFGELEDAVKSGSVYRLKGIGPRYTRATVEAVAKYRQQNADGSSIGNRSTWISIAAILVTITIVLGCTTAKTLNGNAAFPFDGFDGDELFALIATTCALLHYELGRWISGPRVYVDTPITAGRVRLFVAYLGLTIAILGRSSSLDSFRPLAGFLGGVITEETVRILSVGFVFAVWEAGRAFRRDIIWRKLQQETATHEVDDEESDNELEETTFWQRLADWYVAQSPAVKAAIIGGGFLTVQTAINQTAQFIHATVFGTG